MLNILNKDFFKSKTGKRLARKYFGYVYDEEDRDKNEPPDMEQGFQEIKPTVEAQTHDISEIVQQNEKSSESILEDSVQMPDFRGMFKGQKREKREKKMIQPTKNTLTLNELVKYYKNQGVIGEESLVCAITLAAINGSSFGVEGYSGSGKTFIVDKLVNGLLPAVYKIQQSSNLAIFSDVERINNSKFIYVPELQKAMQNKKAPIIEVIKDLTEGKDANRIVTSRKGNGVTEYSIQSGVTIIYTLAVENYFKKDNESSRRLIRFRTDASKEHLDEIHDYKARKRYTIGQSSREARKLERAVKEQINECMVMNDLNIIDPFSGYITELIPKTQKSVGYIDHYYSLLDGCTKFHFNQREKFEINGEKYLLVNLEDHYTVFNMYFKEFIQTLKDLATDEEDVVKEMENIREPDWLECFCQGHQIMMTSPELKKLRDNYPDIVKKWYNSQIKNDRIETTDYVTGKAITITQFSDLINGINVPQLYNGDITVNKNGKKQ